MLKSAGGGPSRLAGLGGTYSAWQVKTLLSQTRAKKDYRDGQTDEGVSMMFAQVRTISLVERVVTRVAAVSKLEEAAADAPFVASDSDTGQGTKQELEQLSLRTGLLTRLLTCSDRGQ